MDTDALSLYYETVRLSDSNWHLYITKDQRRRFLSLVSKIERMKEPRVQDRCLIRYRKSKYKPRPYVNPKYEIPVPECMGTWGKVASQIWYSNHHAHCWGVGTKISIEDWLSVCETYGYRCLCCGSTEAIAIDHVVPLSRGGLHHVSNIQPLCRHCNSSKNAKTIDYR